MKPALPLTVAAAAVSTANLLSTMFAARLMTSTGYGALSKLYALFLTLSLPGTALMVGIVRRTTIWEDFGLAHRVHAWIVRVHRVGALSLVGFVLVVLPAGGTLARALHVSSMIGVDAMIAAGGVWILVSIERGFLQSHRCYTTISANLIIEGVFRALGLLGLIALGTGLTGAAVGILCGELLALVHARLAVRSISSSMVNSVGIESHATPTKEPLLPHAGRDLFGDVGTAMVSLALIAVLQNADMVVFGSWNPARSGWYAAISVPSKALVFWTLLFANYLLPETTIRSNQGQHGIRQLVNTLGLIAPPAVGLLGIAVTMPQRFLGTVFGVRYESAASQLVYLVLAMVLLCITVVLTLYLLAVGWRLVTLPLAMGTVALVSMCWMLHTSLTATVHAELAIQAGLACLMALAVVGRHHRARWRSVRTLHLATQVGSASFTN